MDPWRSAGVFAENECRGSQRLRSPRSGRRGRYDLSIFQKQGGYPRFLVPRAARRMDRLIRSVRVRL